ncbi:bifunctional 2-polyprenyl-6-hydroxyphenol methylase/3-demethylubiquinol 3-O-methyltransferase UbiG [Sneathiella sp. P13V-1]|uniref:bifunctional 2-polyprenyl-6-hydroxyphenol methylase/3-demethylubiquinol 3-O-methyltransferase UbiG n=1 Tax=Sneathiella sp. P13V-1 TaxID=2697366 RepID=UPI00187B8018|nr:bifunctional 2-polyprenyl-6-hydroxyphenol methylase/3-demethylubiquinol 3-O-methyltransferase UbiG [Sneathiella sp. P13V-1]MBE7636564.1 bifunctional 2-polyprenyl-6-hydroxyphenol methylase/3-demethylubiquinol 3-O-methyltransferase UbiG [Sneathiella sp. P13V-1]
MTDAAHAKSVDPQEIANFAAMADEWWDETGKFKPLHKFNPIRIGYIRDQVIQHFNIKSGDNTTLLKPFKGLRLLDIGCGGGLLSEPMARLGAEVVSADASETNINVASLHAEKSGLKIDYRHTTAEDLAEAGEQFDIILNMEVIEHVADLEGFANACCKMLKPGGIMFVATLNRTVKSYALAIVGAEYILRWLPRGTHNWKKFLKPSEVVHLVRRGGLTVEHMTGATYNPLNDKWSLSRDFDVNYMLCATRPE